MTISMKKYEKTLGWIFLAMTPAALPMLIVYLCQLLPVQLDNAQLNIVLFVVSFVLTLLIFHKFLWSNGKQALQKPGKTFLWMGIGFAVYNLGSNLTYLLITRLVPDFANANDANIMDMMQQHYWLMLLGVVVLVPVTEEVLYRGLIFGSLRKRCRWLAYVVGICAFSAMHVVGYIGTLSPLHLLVSFLQYLPGGFALALAYDKSETIWSGILIHSSINLFATLSMR